MAFTFQIKRSSKNPSTIGTVLAISEPLLVTYSVDKVVRPGKTKESCLFFGDGVSTVSKLFENGNYLYVSDTQKPGLSSITTDMLAEGCVTEDKLDPSLGLASMQDITDAIKPIYEKYGELYGINFAKMYQVACNTPSNTPIKEIIIDNFRLPQDFIDNDEYWEYLDGTALLVSFKYSNGAANPKLTVKAINHSGEHPNEIISIMQNIPIFFGDKPLADPFNWRSGDEVMLVFNSKDMRWNLSNTTAMNILASWCADNDMTAINGSMIATGSIDANKIKANSITANQIAVGSLGSNLLSKSVAEAISNANSAAKLINQSKNPLVTCETDTSNNFKEIKLTADMGKSLGVLNGQLVPGISLFVKFKHKSSSAGNNLKLRLIIDGSYTTYTHDIGYYDSEGTFITFVQKEELPTNVFPDVLGWADGDTRLFVFDGTNWIISLPSSITQSMADWCFNHDMTFIAGGNIVTGKISCAELEAGHIDAGTISLSNDTGGFAYANGDDGKNITSGIKMYAYTDSDNVSVGPSAASNYFFVTEGGARMTCKGTSFYINTAGNYAMPELPGLPGVETPVPSGIKGFLYADSNGFVKICTS